ncbi:hypothetical protein HQ393_11930 [Chitinibacter bivalviorum]|uniref:DUF7683 domain-containing protein n=1 Tax=Chitinibacter bivalviorum TaxID=2739434 RepID=A0A7H9BKN8_9NEIS|nr:hypothetical protein [Chitinibacter bivalviorum]QLG88886.1 hypothetical protein HQ393_11930 [Chitinibacter bivalviorum]
MKIIRVLEVWEKGMEGGFVGTLPLDETLDVAFLYSLFAAEQDKPDPEMKLSYMLDESRLAALQPFVAQSTDFEQFDYILSAHGIPDYE